MLLPSPQAVFSWPGRAGAIQPRGSTTRAANGSVFGDLTSPTFHTGPWSLDTACYYYLATGSSRPSRGFAGTPPEVTQRANVLVRASWLAAILWVNLANPGAAGRSTRRSRCVLSGVPQCAVALVANIMGLSGVPRVRVLTVWWRCGCAAPGPSPRSAGGARVVVVVEQPQRPRPNWSPHQVTTSSPSATSFGDNHPHLPGHALLCSRCPESSAVVAARAPQATRAPEVKHGLTRFRRATGVTVSVICGELVAPSQNFRRRGSSGPRLAQCRLGPLQWRWGWHRCGPVATAGRSGWAFTPPSYLLSARAR